MKQLLLIFGLSFSVFASAQMDNVQLEELLAQKGDSIVGTAGRWQVTFQELPMMVITDETNDRMRIIAAIVEVEKLDERILLDCLAANFHSALDVKYAISNDIMWSIFVHPLSALTEEELNSAIEQVYYAAATFGGTYTSTPLLFGGGETVKKPKINLNKG